MAIVHITLIASDSLFSCITSIQRDGVEDSFWCHPTVARLSWTQREGVALPAGGRGDEEEREQALERGSDWSVQEHPAI
ncbi:hypothetical protein FH972_026397 [Carpinus fangiana]|uniref:Uncharacterized protein n=1 Tax=Carpinus fangiana TaxID=176857 RepID=A0A5N6L3T6_9ROSI|nr:hypothetical protein FH972_026397 [Carpinus fangiana]